MLKNNSVVTPNRPVVTHQPLLHIPHIHLASKVLKWGTVAIVGICGLVVALQLIYPANRSLPGISFGGFSLGNLPEAQIANQLSGINSKTFTARTENHAYAQSLSEIGISLDTERIADKLADYPLQQRLLPFSFFYFRPVTPDNHLVVSDSKKLDVFAQKVAAENSTVPVEGSISNVNGSFSIERSVPGRKYSKETLASYFAAYTNESLADEAVLPFEAVNPVNDFQYLESLVQKAEALKNTSHTVMATNAAYEVDKSAVAYALQFPKDEAGKLVISFDAKILAIGLEAAADGAFNREGNIELDREKTAEVLAVAMTKGQTSAPIVLKPLPAGALYPASSKGIQQLITDWQKSHGSIDPVIAFSEIGNYSRTAHVGGDTKYFSASVYKVFPAWYALDQIDQGKLDPSGVIAAGMKLDACFYDMIIISQSNCSEAIVTKYGGWGVMDSFAREHGIEGITLSSGVNITANGMVSFLTKLHNGELLSPERTTYLLDAMKKQKYRTGFPAGSIGPVANKVGYQPRTKSWHDAGIIYDPKTTYVLVVLTKQAAALPTLSTLSQQISATLNR